MPDALDAGFDDAQLGIGDDRRPKAVALQSRFERPDIVEEVDRQRVYLGQRKVAAATGRFRTSQWETHTFLLVRVGVVLIHRVGPLCVGAAYLTIWHTATPGG